MHEIGRADNVGAMEDARFAFDLVVAGQGVG